MIGSRDKWQQQVFQMGDEVSQEKLTGRVTKRERGSLLSNRHYYAV